VEETKKELSQKYPILDIDGVRAIFPKGWGLVRASNTQEILVLRFEGDTEEALKAIESEIRQIVENVIKRLDLN
jgi:phosphomannomutase/phosphoglucomutase